MKPRSFQLLFAALLLQSGVARAQSVEPETAAKIGLGGMAAAAAAIALGNSESRVYPTIGTDGTVLPPPIFPGFGPLPPGSGPLPPGGAAGISGASGTPGGSSASGSQSAGFEQLLITAVNTVIVISTETTSTTSSTGTSP